MPERLRRIVRAAAVAIAAVGLVGCVAVDAELEVLADDSVRVDATYWLAPELSTGDSCRWFSRVAPVDLDVVRLASDGGRVGCRMLGTTTLEKMANRHLVAIRDDGTYSFTFLPVTSRWPVGAVDTAVPDFDVRVTFPGEVVQADRNALVEGRTVRWTRASSMLGTGMRATALDAPPLDAWPMVAGLGVPGALLVGLVAGMVVGRRRPAPVVATDPLAALAAEPEPLTTAAPPPDFWVRPPEPEDPSVWAPDPGVWAPGPGER